MGIRKALLLAVICTATAAHGAKRSAEPEVWVQEPTSFLGIKLDEKLIYQMKQCPEDYSDPDGMCYERPFQGYYPLRSTPPLGIGYGAAVMTHDSQIREIRLTTKEGNYDNVKSMLLQKYGRPLKQSSETVKTKVGAAFKNEKIYWDGKKVTIVLERYYDTIDKSRVSVINKDVAHKAIKAENDKMTDSASKL
ncbi:hypothetical protein [Pseudomonas sp. NMI4491_12]|uniref:hypothetical protein n=1 Tax=Pseudomonas sp. NMI4491_12 TaxID=2903146 RepID=UPI001E4876A2|nr:hypothetical protein [Pseudomonas sp. NMI4491_12]MCE0968506.1 hypothetical protein [Pseudomonas sp. NMI4491_12]